MAPNDVRKAATGLRGSFYAQERRNLERRNLGWIDQAAWLRTFLASTFR